MWKILLSVFFFGQILPQDFTFTRSFETRAECEAYIPVAEKERPQSEHVQYYRLRCQLFNDEATALEEMVRQGGLMKVYCEAYPATEGCAELLKRKAF